MLITRNNQQHDKPVVLDCLTCINPHCEACILAEAYYKKQAEANKPVKQPDNLWEAFCL